MKGSELQEWRRVRGVQQQELARKLGVHIITVNRWENGAREIPPLLELALDGLIARKAVPKPKKALTRK